MNSPAIVSVNLVGHSVIMCADRTAKELKLNELYCNDEDAKHMLPEKKATT